MLSNFIEQVKEIDKKILKFMFFGFKISLLICLVGTYILELNNCNYTYHAIHQAGIMFLQMGIMFACCFFEFGFVVDKLR